MNRTLFLFCLTFLFVLPGEALAHCPRMVEKPVTIIQAPEKSQAFYGELTGRAHRFIIRSSKEFRLFLQLMEPNIPSSRKMFGFSLCKKTESGCQQEVFETNPSSWRLFYEEFVGDHYWIGPTFSDTLLKNPLGMKGLKMPAGTYQIDVFSPGNMGKYILGVGDAEEWPMKEILNAVILLPSLKQFFEKPMWAYCTTPYTIAMAIVVLALLSGLILWIYRMFR